jgi:hypothetical protein
MNGVPARRGATHHLAGMFFVATVFSQCPCTIVSHSLDRSLHCERPRPSTLALAIYPELRLIGRNAMALVWQRHLSGTAEPREPPAQDTSERGLIER